MREVFLKGGKYIYKGDINPILSYVYHRTKNIKKYTEIIRPQSPHVVDKNNSPSWLATNINIVQYGSDTDEYFPITEDNEVFFEPSESFDRIDVTCYGPFLSDEITLFVHATDSSGATIEIEHSFKTGKKIIPSISVPLEFDEPLQNANIKFSRTSYSNSTLFRLLQRGFSQERRIRGEQSRKMHIGKPQTRSKKKTIHRL